MLYYIKGKIISKNNKSAVVLNNDIGYKIFLTKTMLEKIKTEQLIELYTYLKHSEDNMSLYGFEQEAELKFFELLISISGVGPKSALGVLEVAKLENIKKAILRDDASILYKVSGVGKKTAERIVVELKNKLDQMPVGEKDINLSDIDTETFDALVALGYGERDVRDALRQLPDTAEKMEDKIKLALKFLGKG